MQLDLLSSKFLRATGLQRNTCHLQCMKDCPCSAAFFIQQTEAHSSTTSIGALVTQCRHWLRQGHWKHVQYIKTLVFCFSIVHSKVRHSCALGVLAQIYWYTHMNKPATSILILRIAPQKRTCNQLHQHTAQHPGGRIGPSLSFFAGRQWGAKS